MSKLKLSRWFEWEEDEDEEVLLLAVGRDASSFSIRRGRLIM